MSCLGDTWYCTIWNIIAHMIFQLRSCHGKSSIYLRVDQCRLQTHVCFRYKYASSLYTPAVYVLLFWQYKKKDSQSRTRKVAQHCRVQMCCCVHNKNPIGAQVWDRDQGLHETTKQLPCPTKNHHHQDDCIVSGLKCWKCIHRSGRNTMPGEILTLGFTRTRGVLNVTALDRRISLDLRSTPAGWTSPPGLSGTRVTRETVLKMRHNGVPSWHKFDVQ